MVKYKEKLEEQKVFIDGEWTTSSKGDTYSIINPSTGKSFVKCQKCDVEDTKRAIDAARDAFDNGPWPEMSLEERTKIFYKVTDMIAEKAWEISKLDAMCNGVPVLEHASMTMMLPAHMRYVCAQAKKLVEPKKVSGEFPLDQKVWREPDGVVAIITPWNAPFGECMMKLPPALIDGNTVVFKPASQTPLTTLDLGKMFEKAGLPKGVLSIITGPGPVVGVEMAKNTKVDHISFTGEGITGKEIVQNALGNLKKVTLELGGKSPNIIFDDFSVDEAATAAMIGGYFLNGEICIDGSRIFVQDTIHEKFSKKFVELSKSLRIGNALSFNTNIGPLVTETQMEKNLKYIEYGKDAGATLLCGGYRPREGELKDGFFVAPTVFDNVSNDMRIAREEIFGPVLCVIPFSTEEEVIEMANDTTYGLAGAVWTHDKERAVRVARKIKAGTVFINTYHMLTADMPFGGYKQSGWGREMSEHGVEEFTQVKGITADWSGLTKWLMNVIITH